MFAKELQKITMTLLVTVTLALPLAGCGSTKPEDAVNGNHSGEATEAVAEETETENAAEDETTEIQKNTEALVDTETIGETENTEAAEEEVLFRVTITNADGAIVTDQPSSFEFFEEWDVAYGECFDVYKVFENKEENETFYSIKTEDGQTAYVWEDFVQIIE